MATAGTVASGAYPTAIGEADPAVTVSQQACPDLVPLVEGGELSGDHVTAVVGATSMPSVPRSRTSTRCSGLPHYPLLRPVFEALLGPAVSVVDSAFTTALALEDLLDALQARSGPRRDAPRPNRVATTGDPTRSGPSPSASSATRSPSSRDLIAGASAARAD